MGNNIGKYENFQIGTIVWAYYLKDATEEKIQKDIDYFKSFMPLNKAYLENHRGLVTVPQDKMRLAKSVFEKNGIVTSGCITSTGLVGEAKPAIFDTYCYTDETHRAAYVKIVEELAEVFDEIILDDYFFAACRCEKCIAAKGKRSWSEYRLDLMEDFSKVITKRAKEINPKMNFIIKYPNWYESWQETGYNPAKQKDIFDMIYTGTETRETVYSQQHLQRYHSYSMLRYMENVAPGRNGGGWIDPYGCDDNMTRFMEQASFTVLAKAKELMLFNFEDLTKFLVFPPLGSSLQRVDRLLSKTGNPVGMCVYEPHNGEGEDLLYTYLGMRGVAIEPTPEFNAKAPVIFLAQSACIDKDIMSKLEAYVRNGGTAIVTTGFFKEQYENGIKDLTSVRLTGRHASGNEFMINYCNHMETVITKSSEKVSFEVLQYKTNASWSDITVVCDEYNYPLFTEDMYGKGKFHILNVPGNMADLYKLPEAVFAALSKVMSKGQEVYISSDAKATFFNYDNNVIGMYQFESKLAYVKVYVKDPGCALVDLETGERITDKAMQPQPVAWIDGCSPLEDPTEYAFNIQLAPGQLRFFEIV